MKQFLTALAANFVTLAVLVILFFLFVVGMIASLGGQSDVRVPDGAVLVVDLGENIADAPADMQRPSALEAALQQGQGISIRAALLALRAAEEDKRISAVLLRGNVGATGFATLREFRQAILDFRSRSDKPVHAFLVAPETPDYYVASAASSITMDPFGTLHMPGLEAELVFVGDFLQKYGVGVQVTRVGRFKSAVEPFTRSNMSPENRLQTAQYVGSLWSEVKRGVADTRNIDTTALQQLVDTRGILTADDAKAAGLIDRVAYWDALLDDLRTLASADSQPSNANRRIPQVTFADYARIATARNTNFGASNRVAIVYASGTIVDGEGGPGFLGGDALARDLRVVRHDNRVKAVVLRVNSPGGSAMASETILRELALIAEEKPVVVSMGSVAASGGYWISTAASRVFVQPNTITGSIGVFGLMPNVKTLANRHGVTFDTVRTGRYTGLFGITRPRTPQEMEVVQRLTDAIYDAFIERVSKARSLTPDSVRALADGRVWSGEYAVRIGLADSIGGFNDAIKSAVALAELEGDYGVVEFPRRKTGAEALSAFLSPKPPPAAGRVLASEALKLGRELLAELDAYNDPRAVYARMPFLLHVR